MTRSGKNLGLYIFVILTISFIIVFVCVLTALNRYIGTEAYRSIQNCEGFLRKRDSDSYMEYSEGKNLFRSYYFLLEFDSEEFRPDMEYGVENLVRSWCNENRNKTNRKDGGKGDDDPYAQPPGFPEMRSYILRNP